MSLVSSVVVDGRLEYTYVGKTPIDGLIQQGEEEKDPNLRVDKCLADLVPFDRAV